MTVETEKAEDGVVEEKLGRPATRRSRIAAWCVPLLNLVQKPQPLMLSCPGSNPGLPAARLRHNVSVRQLKQPRVQRNQPRLRHSQSLSRPPMPKSRS